MPSQLLGLVSRSHGAQRVKAGRSQSFIVEITQQWERERPDVDLKEEQCALQMLQRRRMLCSEAPSRRPLKA